MGPIVSQVQFFLVLFFWSALLVSQSLSTLENKNDEFSTWSPDSQRELRYSSSRVTDRLTFLRVRNFVCVPMRTEGEARPAGCWVPEKGVSRERPEASWVRPLFWSSCSPSTWYLIIIFSFTPVWSFGSYLVAVVATRGGEFTWRGACPFIARLLLSL